MASHFPMDPTTYVDVMTGADAVARPPEPFAARWTGIRRLDPPITRDCLPAFVTDPAGIPCQVDSVIELTLGGDTLIEVAVGLAFEDLEPFADGRAVTVLLDRSDFYGVPSGSLQWSLEIRDADAGPLLLAVRNFSSFVMGRPWSLTESAWTWDDLELAYGEFLCATERDPCMRVFVSRPLAVTSSGSVVTIEPAEEATVASGGFDYRVTHRRAVERLYGVFESRTPDLAVVTGGIACKRRF